jgi:hypothetical protein
MIYSFFRTFFILIVCGASLVAGASAQIENPAEKEELPKSIKESLVKSRIDREKKDFQELLERGGEAAKLSGELDKSFAENKRLTVEDWKKLERLEKLSKKIREELGASDSTGEVSTANSDDEKVSSMPDAVDKLKNVSQKLSDELKKTTRYTVSAAAIQSSNAVLKIVRFIRQGKN